MLPHNNKFKKVTLIQWNGQSVRGKQQQLKNYLYENSVDIAILSETWFRPTDRIVFQGYYLERLDRNDDHGGVALLISKQLAYSSVTLNDCTFNRGIEVCGVHLDALDINIISVYRPNSVRTSRTDWRTLFSHFSGRTIFSGDFNAAHKMWGSPRDDSLGNLLVDILESQNLIIMNDGSPTRVQRPTQNKSAVDLSIVTSDLVDRLSWSVSGETLGSDHYVIKLCLNETWMSQVVSPTVKWKEEAADWDLYQMIISNRLASLPSQADNSEKMSFLCDAVTTAASDSMPIKKPHNSNRKPPVWWDNDCTNLDKQRRAALQQYKVISNFENYNTYKNIDAQAKRLFKQKSRQSWHTLISKLNKNSSPSFIWNTMKKISNKNYQPNPNTLSKKLIEESMDQMCPSSVPNKPLTLQNNVIIDDSSSISRPFECDELDFALSLKRKSTPGFDYITYNMLHNLPLEAKSNLLEIYNNCLQNKKMLPYFKKIIITLILKPGKEGGLPSSYRPISLLPCVTKVYERMLKLRLEWFLEHHHLLPVTQYGFRKGYSTIDAVAHLVTDIQCTFTKNKYLACLFVDMKGAYDCVDLNILTEKIGDVKPFSEAAATIVDLFRNREIYVRDHRGTLHGPRLLSQGLPQGSILSPLLFNLYTRDLHSIWDDSVTCIQYADDFCFYSIQDTYEESVRSLRHVMYCLKNWVTENNFSLSPEKSAVLIFTRHRIRHEGSIKLAGITIPMVSKYKYLGLILDRKLLWSQHILHIKQKCEKGINMLKFVTRRKHGASPLVALMFYRAYVRAIIDYGCVLYGGASSTNLLIVDRMQLKALRVCMGVMGSSPSYAVLSESHEIPLKYRRLYLASKFILKLQFFSDYDYLNKLCSLTADCLTDKFWLKKNNPPLVDAFLECKNMEYSSTKHFYYDSDYCLFTSKFTVVFPDFNDSPVFNIQLARSVLGDYAGVHIFTDGSKSRDGVGSAFYIPSLGLVWSAKLNNECSIYTAEAHAVNSALEWALESDGMSSLAILSDSMSVLSAIKNSDFRNPIICRIKKNTLKLIARNIKVTFIWIKGHSGIRGNEMVDQAAKSAVSSKRLMCSLYLPSDMMVTLKKGIILQWEREYSKYASNSSNPYFTIHPAPAAPMPYLETARSLACTITRLKMNHGNFPAHLNRIGLRDSAYCICGNNSIGDINHLLFSCTLNYAYRHDFLDTLLGEFQFPINLSTILHSNNLHIFKALIVFLKKSNIDI